MSQFFCLQTNEFGNIKVFCPVNSAFESYIAIFFSNSLTLAYPMGGGGGGVNPLKVFYNNFLTKNDNEMKFWLIVNGLITNL